MRSARVLAVLVTAVAAGVIATTPALPQQSNGNPFLDGPNQFP
jgi:hypothetical protein